MHRPFSAILVTLLIAAFAATQATGGEDLPIEAFYGSYEGSTRPEESQGLLKRQVSVTIQPQKEGFNLTWTTRIPKEDGRVKQSKMSVYFRPTGRPGIYVSAMRRDMFGNEVPLDPLRGDSFMWAQVTGDTLYTYGMLINDDGASDLQVYERTRTEDGLELRFYRFADGWLKKAVTGTLREVER